MLSSTTAALVLLAGAIVTFAAPPTNNTLVARYTPSVDVNWFTRWDCHNPCVENGLCLGDQTTTGDAGSDSGLIYNGGCWDRPDDVHSLSLAVNNGHGFRGISKGCKEWAESRFVAKVWDLGVSEKGVCNVFKGEKIKAVVYQW